MNDSERHRLLQWMADKKATIDYIRHVAALHESNRAETVEEEARKGTVIEGVAVRKPQVRLT